VAQVLRYDDERHWLRAAPKLIGHLFPRLLRQSEYNERLKNLAPLMEATPATAELLRLMDATPVPCGQSVITGRRSSLFGYAGHGYRRSHSRWYWGSKLMLMCTCEGTATGFGLANPKLYGERDQARQMLEHLPGGGPAHRQHARDSRPRGLLVGYGAAHHGPISGVQALLAALYCAEF
jgi:hypothetical protein